MDENRITKNMLNTLRKDRFAKEVNAAKAFVNEKTEKDNFLTKSKVLMEEAVMNKKKTLTESDDHGRSFNITKSTPQFGDVRTSQEEMVKKAIDDNVQFDEDALKYYPDADDMTLDGRIPSLNLNFQFRFNDQGSGCYVWINAMALNDDNTRTIGKINDAYANWRNSIIQDGELMNMLKKAASDND